MKPPEYANKRNHALKLILDDLPVGRTEPCSDREIARLAGISKTTVGRLRQVATEKSLKWLDVAHLGDIEHDRLFNKPSRWASGKRQPAPTIAPTRKSS